MKYGKKAIYLGIFLTTFSLSIMQNLKVDAVNIKSESIMNVSELNWAIDNFDENAYLWGPAGIQGNNLYEGYISPETTEFLMMMYLWGKENYVRVLDADGNIVVEGFVNTILQVSPSSFKADQTYHVYVSDHIITNFKYVGDFDVRSSETNPDPEKVTTPKLDAPIDDQTAIITGSATVGNTVSLKIGGELYREEADVNGKFTFKLEKPFPSGTEIELYATTSEGKMSEIVHGVVKPSNNFLLGVNRVLSVDSVVTGTTLPNIRVEIDVDNSSQRGHIFEGISDSNGDFSINMNGYTFSAGTKMKITAFRGDGVTKSQTIVVYPVAPSVNSVHSYDSYISGRGDSGAKIIIKIENNVFEGTVDAAGNFLIPVTGIAPGALVQIYQISNGISSDMLELIVQNAFDNK